MLHFMRCVNGCGKNLHSSIRHYAILRDCRRQFFYEKLNISCNFILVFKPKLLGINFRIVYSFMYLPWKFYNFSEYFVVHAILNLHFAIYRWFQLFHSRLTKIITLYTFNNYLPSSVLQTLVGIYIAHFWWIFFKFCAPK